MATRAKINNNNTDINKTIKQLEEEIGVELFDREGRTIKLNQQGKFLCF